MNIQNFPKLILFDIDGTLLNDDWEMTPLTKEKLTRLHEAGILLGLASGRPKNDIAFHIRKWGLPFDFDVFVGLNGCELSNEVTGQYSLTHQLEPEQLAEVLKQMTGRFAFIPFIYRDDELLAAGTSDVMTSSARKSGKNLRIVPARELCRLPNPKIMLRTEDAREVTRMEDWLKDHPIPGIKGFKTQATLMEFAHPDISKAVPLQTVCDQLGIAMEDIVCCGDTTNDNEMLEQAGLGICLANGTADTKAAADLVTELDNNHDGLVVYLEALWPELFV